jgi:hypothetical protein
LLHLISLSNENLTSDILESFDMSQVKAKAVLMDKSQKLKKGEGIALPKEIGIERLLVEYIIL